ncbi:MAG: adenylate/guanylate cyclase domain-containing response regulator [Magnetococcales bacterium]|nr:adenylate/guanylate cyclase domain-containing response regulator [Magnetococcales bacterium]
MTNQQHAMADQDLVAGQHPDLPAADEAVFFAAEEEAAPQQSEAEPWKILIVDDEEGIHSVTRIALDDVLFQGRRLLFLSAFNFAEAIIALAANPDIAVLLLDVVMEEDDTGLKLVKYIRDELGNHMIRIVLRTGQPGMVPEKDVVIKYQINDYKTKSDLTYQKLFTTVVSLLRSYQDLENLKHSNRRLREESEKRQQALEKIEHKTRAFERFIPRNFLQHLGKDEIENLNYGDATVQPMTILFSDIRNFTNLSESMSHLQNFSFINNYLKFVGPMIQKHGGFIDKFIGDCIMALFSAQDGDRGCGAIGAAIEMMQILKIYNGYRKNSGYRPIRVGIGIHMGLVYLGTVGFEERMDTTVVGDAVNLASRLESLTKHYGISVAISHSAKAAIEPGKGYRLREIDTVRVKGKMDPVTIWEVFDGADESWVSQLEQALPQYNEGLRWYKERQWQKAEAVFADLDRHLVEDPVSHIYLERCRRFIQERPDDGWDGVTQL